MTVFHMRTLYNTLILPHLYYGILLWGHDNTRFHMLQKRAIRTITISKYNAHIVKHLIS